MKKYILFFIVIVLSACASQETVTPESTVTSTPPPTAMLIPTPTFHPQFTALQNEIIDTSTRFTLQADGLIYDGEIPVPGITVALDGTMTISVNNETVIIDSADMSFDDEEGITIEGYSFEDKNPADGVEGEWVAMVIPEKTEMGIEILGIMQNLGVDVGENGTVALQMDGNSVVCIEKITGDIVCRDGVLTLDFLQEALSASDLVGGPQELPDPNSGRPNQIVYGSPIKEFSVRLVSLFREQFIEVTGKDSRLTGDRQNGRIERVLIGENYWAVAVGEKIGDEVLFNYLAFEPRDKPGEVDWYQIIPVPADKFDQIWADNN